MRYATSIVVSAVAFLAISCSSSHCGGGAKVGLASRPIEEQLRVENASRMRIGLRVVDPTWSFDASNRTFQGREVWIVATPDDPNCKTRVMKVVKRHPDGTIAEEQDYYSSGRYFFLEAEGPGMEKKGIHDEFLYLAYKYDSRTLSLQYVGKDVEIYDKCKELNSQPRTFAEVASVTDRILLIWHLSRL